MSFKIYIHFLLEQQQNKTSYFTTIRYFYANAIATTFQPPIPFLNFELMIGRLALMIGSTQ